MTQGKTIRVLIQLFSLITNQMELMIYRRVKVMFKAV